MACRALNLTKKTNKLYNLFNLHSLTQDQGKTNKKLFEDGVLDAMRYVVRSPRLPV